MRIIEAANPDIMGDDQRSEVVNIFDNRAYANPNVEIEYDVYVGESFEGTSNVKVVLDKDKRTVLELSID